MEGETEAREEGGQTPKASTRHVSPPQCSFVWGKCKGKAKGKGKGQGAMGRQMYVCKAIVCKGAGRQCVKGKQQGTYMACCRHVRGRKVRHLPFSSSPRHVCQGQLSCKGEGQ